MIQINIMFNYSRVKEPHAGRILQLVLKRKCINKALHPKNSFYSWVKLCQMPYIR